ncbi:MAG: hypothetical protein C0434_09750 [Xanthomonadaceae bacterium]|nr:hypothetical protein [Xanthomonadaceae bacterium]
MFGSEPIIWMPVIRVIAMGTVDCAEQYGKLKATDYARLLRDAKEARLSRIEIETEASREGSKLADLLKEHGTYWWHFYELPLPMHLALFGHLVGWTEQIIEVGKAENPHRAFLEFMDTQEELDDNTVAALDPPSQVLLINVLIAVMNSLEALCYYGLTINELLEKARAGNIIAFCNAVSIDRTVIGTDVGAQLIAHAQLKRNKAFLSGLFRRIRNPHSGRRQYLDLRLMHRVFKESGVISECRPEQVLDLAEKLDLYTGRRGDPVKGLSELFRNWNKEATS